MPIAGYCHECGGWVFVESDWSCPEGHPAATVNGWYETGSGSAVAPAGPSAPIPGVSAAGTRVGFLTDLTSAFAQAPAYSAAWGSDTDMTIVSNPVDGIWGLGKARAEYEAALKVSEGERTIHFWEMLKERSGGIPLGAPASGSDAPADPSVAREDGVAGSGSDSSEWGYGTTRRVVEEVAARHGFTVRVVLTRRAAAW